MSGAITSDYLKFSKALFAFESYALFCHIHPDGDTIGSAVALQLILRSMGKTADIYCSDAVPEKFGYIVPEMGEIRSGDISKNYQAYVAVDISASDRIGVYEGRFNSEKNTFCIDHHATNAGFAKYNLIIDCAANCENIYNIAKAANAVIDKKTATALYTGICTDTGNFTHSNVSATSFTYSAELTALGADTVNVYYNAFERQSKNRAKLYGVTMSKIEYYLDGKFAVIAVDKITMEKCGALKSDTSGFIDFIMGIEGVKAGACLMESSPNCWKVSLRGRNVNVCAVAESFGGGGHKFAAGCTVCGFLYDIIEKTVKLMGEVIDA